MFISDYAAWTLEQEARALLARLGRVKPFALLEPMVPAAALLPGAQTAIERFLMEGRRDLRKLVHGYIQWLRSGRARETSTAEAQRRFTILRLKFNAVLTQFDMFYDVISQRCENETGVWLSGLDVVSADALALPGGYYEPPPIICYLDRGIGAAIRRARTRLPGGGSNPVAIIRVPRERMVGSGVASSLIHEVGHQAAALLDLTASLRQVLQSLQRGNARDADIWYLWERWIAEIVADLWSVARVGIGSTQGLMGVVGLPRPFVFRMSVDDPHPVPWIRVKLSCAMGSELYPHPQWARFAALWESFYPLAMVDTERRQLLVRLQASIPAFVALLVNHRPPSLRGQSLREALSVGERQPARLAALFRNWCDTPGEAYRESPTLVFAVIGQARADGQLSPEGESQLLASLLTHWALRSTLDAAASCASPAMQRSLTGAVRDRQEAFLTIHEEV
jgi:hypothetical protein